MRQSLPLRGSADGRRGRQGRVSYLLDGTHWNLSDPMSIPHLILAHLYLTVVSVGIGLVIAFPLALLISRTRPATASVSHPVRVYAPLIGAASFLFKIPTARLYAPVIGGASFVYTIPSLAFVAFLVPFTGLSNPLTMIIPLVAYTQLVLIRNIVAAIRAVDPALVEVGRAMGMNGPQLQVRVVLPLSLPVIVAGIRVATVTTIGIATIAQWVGVADIGTLIYQGQNFAYNDEILAGVIVVSLFAILADLLLLAVQAVLGRGRQIVPAT
jgi:osmoprotectant transport system permease protein